MIIESNNNNNNDNNNNTDNHTNTAFLTQFQHISTRVSCVLSAFNVYCGGEEHPESRQPLTLVTGSGV